MTRLSRSSFYSVVQARVFDISQQFKENEENEDNQVSAETAINMRIERVFAYRAVCN